MASPNRPPTQSNRRDPARTAAGKAVIADMIAKQSDPGSLTCDAVADAIYYLDGTLFLPAGFAKAGRMVRAEARKRGIL